MSNIYKVGVGHNVDPGDMVTLDQQPFVHPMQVVERRYGMNGTYYDDGRYVVFHYDMIESATLYGTILTRFGLNTANTANVTIYAWNELLQWAQCNGVAHRPEPGVDAKWDRFFWRDVNIYVTDLVVIGIVA